MGLILKPPPKPEIFFFPLTSSYLVICETTPESFLSGATFAYSEKERWWVVLLLWGLDWNFPQGSKRHFLGEGSPTGGP